MLKVMTAVRTFFKSPVTEGAGTALLLAFWLLDARIATARPDPPPSTPIVKPSLPEDGVSSSDFDKFIVGRSKLETLSDFNWRTGRVTAGRCGSSTMMAVSFTLHTNPAALYQCSGFSAVFVDGKLGKLAPFDRGGRGDVVKHGADEHVHLVYVRESKAVSSADLIQEANAKEKYVPKDSGNLGLGLALWASGFVFKDATPAQLARNSALRSQFNAARLDIGITPADVRKRFGADPLQSGKIDEGDCEVYGSFERFPISPQDEYDNVVVVYRNGKVASFFSFTPSVKNNDTIAKLRADDAETDRFKSRK